MLHGKKRKFLQMACQFFLFIFWPEFCPRLHSVIDKDCILNIRGTIAWQEEMIYNLSRKSAHMVQVAIQYNTGTYETYSLF